jgi:hypothetical protein
MNPDTISFDLALIYVNAVLIYRRIRCPISGRSSDSDLNSAIQKPQLQKQDIRNAAQLRPLQVRVSAVKRISGAWSFFEMGQYEDINKRPRPEPRRGATLARYLASKFGDLAIVTSALARSCSGETRGMSRRIVWQAQGRVQDLRNTISAQSPGCNVSTIAGKTTSFSKAICFLSLWIKSWTIRSTLSRRSS